MATVVLTWECERDTFHFMRYKRIRKQLTEMGHQVYLVDSNLRIINENESSPYFPDPGTSMKNYARTPKTGCFSDKLVALGFNNPRILNASIIAWEQLFSLLKPQLLICDAAPVATLAAYHIIPCIQLSDGINLPPAHLADFPKLNPFIATSNSASYTHSMLNNIRMIQMQRKKRFPPTLPALFKSEFTFITHVPELDPYLRFREEDTQYGVKYGPFSSLPDYRTQHRKTHFFAYLDFTYPEIEQKICVALANMNIPGYFYIPDAPPELNNFLVHFGMKVHTQPPNLEELLTQCAFVVHHGNIHIAEVALATGLPQFSLPIHFEEYWLGKYLSDHNVGVILKPKYKSAESISNEIEQCYKKLPLSDWPTLRAYYMWQKKHVPLESHLWKACQQIL